MERWIRHSTRSGRDQRYDSDAFLDPATANQRLLTVVTGLEYQRDAFDDRLQGILFAKSYVYSAAGEGGHDYLGPALIESGFLERRMQKHPFGMGNALRFHLLPDLMAKASYEYATRFPDPDQVYGDGVLTVPNLDLEPERSHNLNGGLSWRIEDRDRGHFLRGSADVFLRSTDRLIFDVPVSVRYRQNHNAWSSRSQGARAALGWTSPGRYVWLDANGTWANVRNTSREGIFVDYQGDRIPNRPWLFFNASARVQFSRLTSAFDEMTFSWHSNYVHSFFRSWESAGRRDYKVVVPPQLLHSAVLTYRVESSLTVSSSLEIQNLTDAIAYDFVGVQKPGRTFHFKGTLEY